RKRGGCVWRRANFGRDFDGRRGGRRGWRLRARSAKRVAPVLGGGRRRRFAATRATRGTDDSHDVFHRQRVKHELDVALLAPLLEVAAEQLLSVHAGGPRRGRG